MTNIKLLAAATAFALTAPSTHAATVTYTVEDVTVGANQNYTINHNFIPFSAGEIVDLKFTLDTDAVAVNGSYFAGSSGYNWGAVDFEITNGVQSISFQWQMETYDFLPDYIAFVNTNNPNQNAFFQDPYYSNITLGTAGQTLSYFTQGADTFYEGSAIGQPFNGASINSKGGFDIKIEGDTSEVPLPGALSLAVTGLAGLFALRRRQLACKDASRTTPENGSAGRPELKSYFPMQFRLHYPCNYVIAFKQIDFLKEKIMKNVFQTLVLLASAVTLSVPADAATVTLSYLTQVDSQNFTINPDALPVLDAGTYSVGFSFDSDTVSTKAMAFGYIYDYFGDVDLNISTVGGTFVATVGQYGVYGITGTNFVALEKIGTGEIVVMEDADLSVSPFTLTAGNYLSALAQGYNTLITSVSYGSSVNGGAFASQDGINMTMSAAVSQVPLPGGLLFLAGGLGGLALMRRRSGESTPAV